MIKLVLEMTVSILWTKIWSVVQSPNDFLTPTRLGELQSLISF